jgi:hypothetical protein
MNLLIAVLIGIVQAVTAITGYYVASKKFTYKQKRPFFWVFTALAVTGVGLLIWQNIDAKRSSDESTRMAMGDPDHPPFVELISLPGVHRFVVRNGSNYPSFGIRIRLYDETVRDGPARIVRDWVYSELAAHAAFMDDQLWVPPDNAPQRRFSATIATRTGIVTKI